MSQQLLTTTRDPRGVLTLTLNRPEIHNAFNDRLVAALTERIEAAGHDSDVRVLLLAGEGKSFSAGADLNWMRSKAEAAESENLADALALAGLMERLDRLPKPTIARVHGPAFGGGVGLIACCDIAIGTPQVKMALSEVKLGLVPAVIGPYVVRAIGPRQARRYFQTAETMNADTAQRLGLLHEVVAATVLDERIAEIVNSVLGAGPAALETAKKLVALTQEDRPAKLSRRTAEIIARLRASAEGREGLSAFLEKRQPKWHHG